MAGTTSINCGLSHGASWALASWWGVRAAWPCLLARAIGELPRRARHGPRRASNLLLPGRTGPEADIALSRCHVRSDPEIPDARASGFIFPIPAKSGSGKSRLFSRPNRDGAGRGFGDFGVCVRCGGPRMIYSLGKLTAALAGAPRIEGRVELEHRNQTTV